MNMPSHEELYDRFVEGLESKHRGAFAAVRSDGQVIVDRDDVKVVDLALKRFGPGNFVLLKVGSRGVGKWRSQREPPSHCVSSPERGSAIDLSFLCLPSNLVPSVFPSTSAGPKSDCR